MSLIRSLGYLRVESTDLPAWQEFGTKILGMSPGRGPSEKSLYLRMDSLPARIVVTPGSRDRLVATGWEVADFSALARLRDVLESAGVAVKPVDDLGDRRVAEAFAVDDPSGNRLEFFCGAALDTRPFASPYGTTFVTGEQGMGHAVLPATDDAASLRFYTEVLGFRLRDSMRLHPEMIGLPPSDTPLWMRFLGCGPRHHSIAFAPIPAPTGMVHLMMETASIDDVGRAIDRCGRHKAPMISTLGRHANDEMISFYVRTPSGFDIEYGYGGLTVDDPTWVARETTSHSVWGHRFFGGGGH
ncbi:3,4-dihydroxy-9,10-secoandrosta-1,3,5(10)-triene-9,17-dione 4,5-dioxygenase [Actinoplanes lutulentus]|uniref:3,4-dihydroxy-9,10-secoandrosta-1,3, 5(10)-triene-9,17-dione 4,5-dioxygenase n=1 Tax=Actinoplanes lutulentus TaxID=1287878 RepID=A0A327ZLF7_9ACTN|nr:iron-dependent extradiol dioxygenase HsaC [Actinoplanes lutulentus]MBB2941140.1 3,4-dihydroxy-9,10-secoandrosta-1,3,5(10)-triene-9,17-dione 4,5-dioxygenase [Actinoplanes lutulentus]RAK43449.1 3,4-dihydroxy-9,10-secoandrosta-1,3,5(10)-triene-9,17-dione 4,5-dioxygenase [Actinoplanes lutulentus]